MNSFYSALQKAILEFDDQSITRLTEQIVETGIDPVEAIEKGYIPIIQKVGELFEAGDLFLPELVRTAVLVKEAITKVEKLIPKEKITDRGKVVIGTVQGDIHDIGKDLVINWLSTRGIKIIDIGVDCKVDRFIDYALDENADIIGASALLTTTVPEQEKLIQRLKERGLRNQFEVIVGGAAIDASWAKKIGADGYGKDLVETAEVVQSLLAARKRV